LTWLSAPTITTVYHLGGRGGLHRSFENWWLPLRYVAFEPEPAEAERLRRTHSGRVSIEEVAVGDRPGRRPFYIYSLRDRSGDACSGEDLSSLLPLAPERTHRYRDAAVHLTETANIELDTIDNVAARRRDTPTFVVADVQGAELLALEGASTVLREALLGLRLEVSFIPLYQNQPLFGDVDALMRSRGFALCRLERCGSSAFGPSTDAGPFSVTLEDARPAWADAVYVREAPLPAGAGRWRGTDLANLACYTLANGVGSVGLDILFEALDRGYLRESLDELDPALAATLVARVVDHLDRADQAAVTASDGLRGELDASRRSRLRRALGAMLE
jgi:FkbM family methyltransferase